MTEEAAAWAAPRAVRVWSNIDKRSARLRPDEISGDAWSEGAHYAWELHAHSVAKRVFVKAGSVTFHTFAAGHVTLYPGDVLEIGVGTLHSATAGADGVACIETRRATA